ncbi:uncharacterized protein ARMOST_11204 [Armillaria ostoyae]|uniref:Uncharacterized protein n=1 Tax=Armillaria ostoyae TaxID=47428 RepID=A0A284RGH0_ARMOS|nr:uncharacterized protein ARMOST_11204 [Armillaria ostoyae]
MMNFDELWTAWISPNNPDASADLICVRYPKLHMCIAWIGPLGISKEPHNNLFQAGYVTHCNWISDPGY